MKMFYVTNVRIPGKKANGIQVMQMCEAFANRGIKVELIIPRLNTPANEDPFAYYGVERKFKITKLPPFNLARFGGIWIKIQLLSFAICAFFYAVFNKVDVIISRNEALLFGMNFLQKISFFEGHSNKWNCFSKPALTKCRVLVRPQDDELVGACLARHGRGLFAVTHCGALNVQRQSSLAARHRQIDVCKQFRVD